MSFPEELRRIRKSKGLSQKDMAEKLGVSQPSYAQYERGTRNPKVGTVRKIADALGVPFWELAEWSTIDTSDAAEDLTDSIQQKQKEVFSSPSTIAAHFDGDEFTEDELDDILHYIEFVKSRRKKDPDSDQN